MPKKIHDINKKKPKYKHTHKLKKTIKNTHKNTNDKDKSMQQTNYINYIIFQITMVMERNDL